MAAPRKYPINKMRQDDVRAIVKAQNIIKRLQDFTLAVVSQRDMQTGAVIAMQDPETGERVEPMSKEQLAAAKLLLDKTLPNLQATEISGEVSKTYVIRAPAPSETTEQWLRDYGPKTINHEETPQ